MDAVVTLVNETCARLGEAFDVDVDPVSATAYRSEVDWVFADGERAVNVAALVAALAAGFQSRLAGWPWTASESPFAVEPRG